MAVIDSLFLAEREGGGAVSIMDWASRAPLPRLRLADQMKNGSNRRFPITISPPPAI